LSLGGHAHLTAHSQKLLARRTSCPPQYGLRTPGPRIRPRCAMAYLISTFAPTSSNFFLMLAASSLETPSFRVPGAPSTRSLASFSPRLVTSRTTLMVLILSPAAPRTTVDSVFSSSTGAPPAPRAPPAPPPALASAP